MGAKKQNIKSLKKARELKMTRQRYFRLFLVSLFVAFICLIGYMLLVSQGLFNSSDTVTGFAVNTIFLIFAGVVGTFSYKWTKAFRAYKEFILDNALFDQDV